MFTIVPVPKHPKITRTPCSVLRVVVRGKSRPGTLATRGTDEFEMDVHLSVSFLRAQLGGTIEEAVRTAVETVLCETVRLLGGQLGDLQRASPEKGQETQSLKLRLEASGGDWRVQSGSTGGFCDTNVGLNKRTIKSTLSRTGCSTHKALNNGGMPEPPVLVEHSDCGGFPDPFDMVSGGPTVEDFEEGHDMTLPTDWELMNRVYKAEHSEGISLIDEGGTAHYADEYLLHGRDLRIITVPLEEDMSELDTAEPEDHLPQFSPTEVKKELPEAQTSSMIKESPVLSLSCEPPCGEASEAGPLMEFGPKDYVEQLRLWLERLCPEVIREYERDGCLCELSRRKLIKFAVSFIMEEFGFYPTSAQKTMLAEHIVKLFPALRLCVPSAGIDGIEHLYDPMSRTGYIETRLRNFRRTLEADKKKYVLKRRRAELGLVDPKPKVEEHAGEETRKWVALLKKTRPLSKNLPTIRSGMERTFAARRKWMSTKRPSINAVLAEYPRFLDVPSTIDLEFEKMFPGKGDAFLTQWSSCVLPKVRQIAEREKHPEIATLLQQAGSQQEDACTLTMLKVLIHLLPPTNTGRASLPTKCSIKHAIRYLVDIAPVGIKVSSLFCDPGPPDGPTPNDQAKPYILSMGPLDTSSRQLYILAPAERVALPLLEGNLISAVDKLFKFLQVFSLGYPMQLSSLYNFLEHLYGLENPQSTSSGKRSKVLELVSRLHTLS
ncbi:hypothetical protein AAFF_G00112230 [Aldrovandia affinis]|uniref:Uncharacterized protein n=1 Tax=Aldrovandia affinis TaxID=143900 RepID=A0AAD7WAV6_9TELE|nr:hypothetical protein AAFF_G00112230 [Aldrovandia affinis]